MAVTVAAKVVFLDIDDVLNTVATRERGEMFEPANIEALNNLLDRVDVKIVLTTTWRVGATLEEWEDVLVNAGAHASGRVIGVTPWLENAPRGIEITAWLEQAPCPVSHFAILDDRTDMDPCLDHLVQTRPEFGLTPAHANEVIGHLGISPVSWTGS